MDAARARSYLLMQSRARMKKSLLSWCSSRRRAHCSNVTDMDVRSLALLQLVNLMPFNLRQIWRQARECWYCVRKSSGKCIVVFPGCPWQQCVCTTRCIGCSAGKCEWMCKALYIKFQSRSCSSRFVLLVQSAPLEPQRARVW